MSSTAAPALPDDRGRPWADHAVVALAVSVLGLWAWRVAPVGDPAAKARVCANALVPLAALCLVAVWVVPSHRSLEPSVRRAWRCLAGALTSWWLAGAVWQLLGRPPLSIADVGQLGFFPLVVAGVFGFPAAAIEAGGRRRFWLDTTIVVLSGAAGVWYFAVWPAIDHGTADTAAVVNTLYPVADLVLLFAACAALLRGRDPATRRSLAWIAAGLISRFVGDLVYSWQALAGTYADGGLPDLTWLGACALFALGARAQRRSGRDAGTPASAAPDAVALPGDVSLLPYGAVVVLFGFVLATTRGAWAPRAGGVLLASIVATALVLARQFLATRENVRLHRRHAGLESERASEARFRSLVQHSSDIILVIDAEGLVRYASPSVARVIGADAEACVGRPLASFVHPEDAQRAGEALVEALGNEGTTGPARYRVRAAGEAAGESAGETADDAWRDVECLATNRSHDPNVNGVVITARDVTERARLEAQLHHQAFHDPLTGLANRTLFRDRVTHALQREGRRPGGVVALFLDLDDFKTVNDSLGHREGDRLLVAVAERLLNATRGCDTVARLGGDEFAVLLENARTEEDAVVVAERIVQAVKSPVSLAGQDVLVGASVGVARARAGEGAEELLRNADVAMYKAKQRGKNTYEIFAPAMHAALVDRLELEADLRRAVAELGCAELRVHYQPIVELSDGAVTGVEALCRWQHPKRGLVAPLVFIPLAEATGLIVPLGRWVLREACAQAARWQARRDPASPLTITVNLSARQLQHPSIVDDVREALDDSGLAPTALVLEITESVIVQDAGAALGTLEALKALGVRLAIDDFGTGYSSLGYLQQFPIDILKIDKSFVDGVARGGSRSALARTIVALGDSLALRCVAEGIEEDAQRQQLQALGCTYGQGFLFARPLPPEELDAVICLPAVTAG